MEINEGRRDILERLYQLFCYEQDIGDLDADARFPVPDNSTFYVIYDCGIPCGFAEFAEKRHLTELFITKKHRDAGKAGEILTKLFDEDTGKWHVPPEFEGIVNIYTMGDYTRQNGIEFDDSGRFSNDGSFADFSSAQSLISAFEINAKKHGECIINRDFIGARKYSSRLFFMKEQAQSRGFTAELADSLLDRGGSVTLWTAGLALSDENTSSKALEALRAIADGESPFKESAATILSEHSGQM